jgi:hypothetical protein
VGGGSRSNCICGGSSSIIWWYVKCRRETMFTVFDNQ